MSVPVIQVRGLQYQYAGGPPALRGVDFDLMPGESVVLMGANGSGKTTFLLHIAGLLQGQGEIRIGGILLEETTLERVRERVGYVFQDSDDQLFMPTVAEDVAFGLLHRGIRPEDAASRAHNALTALGISHLAERAPYHLSAGEKKRAALAGVLVMDPEILIFDEPTTFLDPPGQRELAHQLQMLPQAKLIATHDYWLAKRIAKRGIFFENGIIAGDGPVEELAERFNWRLSD